EVQMETVLGGLPPLELSPKEQGVLQGGVDQVEIIDVVVIGLHAPHRDKGVEQGVFVVYLQFYLVKSVAQGLDAGGTESKLEIPLVRHDVPPDEGIGVEGHLGEEDL